jgi:hypothetical protein
VSYWDETRQLYVACGFYSPSQPSNIFVPFTIVETLKSLVLKLRGESKTLIRMLKEEQDEKEEFSNKKEKKDDKKERKISEVLEKVALWRRLYTGCHD